MGLRVTFDDTFKADNHILSIVSRANGMIVWMVIDFISRKANVILKAYKTQIIIILISRHQHGYP